MFRWISPFWKSLIVCLSLCQALSSAPQDIDERIMSEHVRIRIPFEREWLARNAVTDLERCWKFLDAATGESLPRRVLLVIHWDGALSTTDFRTAVISIGMDDPSAAADMRAFLVHNAARQLARLGLNNLSKGSAFKEETEFLAEGMAEILVHEYERTTRSLGGAWVIARLLDQMKLLGLSTQSSWTTFSGGRQNLRSAAPGITFLITCRELYGRDKLLKAFEGMKKGSLDQTLSSAFKTPTARLEAEWLKRVREYNAVDDITLTSAGDAPELQRTILQPAVVRPGGILEIHLYIKDEGRNLVSDGVFVQDVQNMMVIQTQRASDQGGTYFSAGLAIEPDRKPGEYAYLVTAVDEAGNVRHWKGTYKVVS